MEFGTEYLGDNQFLQAVNFTFPHEFNLKDPNGGYTNNPSDPGGETKWGISKRAYPDVDIKSLTLPQATSIYYTDYWEPNCAGMVPPSLAVCHFDSCVNNGVQRAAKWLDASNYLWDGYTTLRRKFYYAIAADDPAKQQFLDGWINRVNDLRKYCTILDEENRTSNG